MSSSFIHWIESGFSAVITVLVSLIVLVVLYDMFQKKHAILRNFPLLGHFRYWLEQLGPELRQYLVANDKEERPFSRNERRWIYATAKGENNNFGFGTSEDLHQSGYVIIKHAAFPHTPGKAHGDGADEACLKVIGLSHNRDRPYRPPSMVNISAMSYGSLGRNAIASLNQGAKQANCFHNTGEGGVSEHHLHGADLVWQLGTGYYGARQSNGRLCYETLRDKVRRHSEIKAIELKLSQGAKPGKGGILPASKVTSEIARIRGIEEGQSCISPSAHPEFNTVDGLIDCVEKMASCTGLPVGVKSAVGQIAFWRELAVRMKERGCGPDFICIDGGEGGTGAAPLVFSDHVSLPIFEAFPRVYQIFQEESVAQGVVWIGAGKLGLPDRAIQAFAMGCDSIQIAREAMLAIGCIQAQECHTGRCPSGVATHNAWLQRGLVVDDKSERFARFISGFRQELLSLSHAAGYSHPGYFRSRDLEICTGVNQFTNFADILGYD